jgi:hypothetical protein
MHFHRHLHRSLHRPLPRRRATSLHVSLPLLAVALVLVPLPLMGCGSETAPESIELPAVVEVEVPDSPLVHMELVEDSTEEVANRMLGFSDKLRRRDFRGAADWLTPDFAGHSVAKLATESVEELPLGARRTHYLRSSAKVVGRDDFLTSFQERIGPWKRVESVQWKVKGAEFQTGKPRWGRIKTKVTILGQAEDGGPRALVAWGYGRQAHRGGQWMLERFELTSLSEESRATFLFTDVSTSAGVAHAGIRFGQPGNDSFAWNGAASGDVDGDGRFDIFVPSHPRNFLYVARAEGGFREVAEERGVAQPAGGTGAVFFDFDNDGDQDLAVADVGWRQLDGRVAGNPLRLHLNEGDGRFTRAEGLGFDTLSYGFTLSALDDQLDGLLDLFVANYGVVAKEPNNSWTDASNGMSNQLFRNREGLRFEDVTKLAGLTDNRWSYACAVADHDLDGDQDIYVANDYAENLLWSNNGQGRFEDVSQDSGVRDLGNGMGVTFGDLDSDGLPDLYVANMTSTAGNRILHRLSQQDDSATQALFKMAGGNSVFLATPGSADDDTSDHRYERFSPDQGGVGASWAWAPLVQDLDLDGCLDLFCANGFVTGNTAADT